MSQRSSSSDLRRGCALLLVGLPLVGACAVGAGGAVLVLLLFLLMFVGCSAPPLTVGYIAYPPPGTRVAAGQVDVHVWAYRRGWAFLQFDSGWSYSTHPPEGIRLEVDGRTVFTWSRQKGEELPWNPGTIPVTLSPGEHELRLIVEEGRSRAVDAVKVTAVEQHPWQVWSIPSLNEPDAREALFVDVGGELWRAVEGKRDRAWLEVKDLDPALPVGEYGGLLLSIEGRRARFFNLDNGQTYTLTTDESLPAHAATALLLVRTDGLAEVLWYALRPLERWDGVAWQRTDFRVPVPPTYLVRSNVRAPDDIWFIRRHAARWDGQAWHLIERPHAEARFLRDGVALAGDVFYVWDGHTWQATDPFPPTPDPFVLDFAGLGSEQRVVRCGDSLWFVHNAQSWEPDDPAARGRLRIWRWEGHEWSWKEVSAGEDAYAYGELACVGRTPWLIVGSARRTLRSGGSQVSNRFGGRFLGPESGSALDYGQVWRWDGQSWQPAVQPPLWGTYGGDRLQGEGLGVASWSTGRVAVAREP